MFQSFYRKHFSVLSPRQFFRGMLENVCESLPGGLSPEALFISANVAISGSYLRLQGIILSFLKLKSKRLKVGHNVGHIVVCVSAHISQTKFEDKLHCA